MLNSIGIISEMFCLFYQELCFLSFDFEEVLLISKGYLYFIWNKNIYIKTSRVVRTRSPILNTCVSCEWLVHSYIFPSWPLDGSFRRMGVTSASASTGRPGRASRRWLRWRAPWYNSASIATWCPRRAATSAIRPAPVSVCACVGTLLAWLIHYSTFSPFLAM